MPIYEYRCQACGARFEKLVRLSARPQDIECPACGQRKAQKTVSLIGRLGGEPSAPRPSGASCAPSS